VDGLWRNHTLTDSIKQTLRACALGIVVVAASCGSADSNSQQDTALSTTVVSEAPSSTITATTSPTVSSIAPDSKWVDAIATGAALTVERQRLTGDRIDVVERFARTVPEGTFPNGGIASTEDGELIDSATRAAIERAVAPTIVDWIASTADASPRDGVQGPTVLIVGQPTIDGESAEIATAIWCGMMCGTGATYVLHWANVVGWLQHDIVNTWVS
jgi:hypothetical protein